MRKDSTQVIVRGHPGGIRKDSTQVIVRGHPGGIKKDSTQVIVRGHPRGKKIQTKKQTKTTLRSPSGHIFQKSRAQEPNLRASPQGIGRELVSLVLEGHDVLSL